MAPGLATSPEVACHGDSGAAASRRRARRRRAEGRHLVWALSRLQAVASHHTAGGGGGGGGGGGAGGGAPPAPGPPAAGGAAACAGPLRQLSLAEAWARAAARRLVFEPMAPEGVQLEDGRTMPDAEFDLEELRKIARTVQDARVWLGLNRVAGQCEFEAKQKELEGLKVSFFQQVHKEARDWLAKNRLAGPGGYEALQKEIKGILESFTPQNSCSTARSTFEEEKSDIGETSMTEKAVQDTRGGLDKKPLAEPDESEAKQKELEGSENFFTQQLVQDTRDGLDKNQLAGPDEIEAKRKVDHHPMSDIKLIGTGTNANVCTTDDSTVSETKQRHASDGKQLEDGRTRSDSMCGAVKPDIDAILKSCRDDGFHSEEDLTVIEESLRRNYG